MPKVFVKLKDLIKNSKGWGKEFEDEKEAKEFLDSPSNDKLQLSALIYMAELLEVIALNHQKILEEHKKFYSEFMREKELLRKLRK